MEFVCVCVCVCMCMSNIYLNIKKKVFRHASWAGEQLAAIGRGRSRPWVPPFRSRTPLSNLSTAKHSIDLPSCRAFSSTVFISSTTFLFSLFFSFFLFSFWSSFDVRKHCQSGRGLDPLLMLLQDFRFNPLGYKSRQARFSQRWPRGFVNFARWKCQSPVLLSRIDSTQLK